MQAGNHAEGDPPDFYCAAHRRAWNRGVLCTFLIFALLPGLQSSYASAALPPLPKAARLAFEETWRDGAIDAKRWYPLRKKWGEGNNGVVPETIRIAREKLNGFRFAGGSSPRSLAACIA